MNRTTLIEENLFLAEVIALEYSNIPGCQGCDALSEANLGLIKAAEAYNPEKGEFTPFASKVIRNSLNSLYAKQIRLFNHFPYVTHSGLTDGIVVDDLDSFSDCLQQSIRHEKADVITEIRKNEAADVLSSVMNLLTPRERMAIKALLAGKNYPEIGENLGMTKQAAHKLVRTGLNKLRCGLVRLGYQGIASDGLLGSSFQKKSSKPG